MPVITALVATCLQQQTPRETTAGFHREKWFSTSTASPT